MLLAMTVINEQGTGYQCLKSIGLKSETYHIKKHPSLIQFVKFERDWIPGKSVLGLYKSLKTRELSMDWRDNCPSNHTKLS